VARDRQTPDRPAHDPATDRPDPAYDSPDYRSTALRAPHQPLVWLPAGPTERHGPLFSDLPVDPGERDLTRNAATAGGEPLGERIRVSGRLVGSDGRPIAGQLVEIWQANAAGRYAHEVDRHPAPLDPNFLGAGRLLTDAEGRYAFTTIKPGAYPWRNHHNAWRPAHIHFSVFGRAFSERLITQMYFPGDPLLAHDPIVAAVVDPDARRRLVCDFDWDTTEPEWALGYRFDLVVGDHLAGGGTPTTGTAATGDVATPTGTAATGDVATPTGTTATGDVATRTGTRP
jgi:protocatechuate 3,4-dioxygenase beta subunit